MRNYKIWIFALILFFIFGCGNAKIENELVKYNSDNLIISQISKNVYRHTSFLQTQSFGKVSCNGMLVVDAGEAIIFDTPTDNISSQELILWVRKNLDCDIKAVIPTHFHSDCLGGLEAFHKNKIPSYANNLTIALAENNKSVLPLNSFEKRREWQVGNKKVYAEFVGEGHTKDNIVGYFPSENVLFGGCLLKETGAGKGNLEDANVEVWAETVRQVKLKYPEIRYVIPGHGKTGNTELLEYTINLFEME